MLSSWQWVDAVCASVAGGLVCVKLPNMADKREDFLARDKRFLHRLVRLHEIGVGDDPLGVLALLLDHTLQCRLVQLAVG